MTSHNEVDSMIEDMYKHAGESGLSVGEYLNEYANGLKEVRMYVIIIYYINIYYNYMYIFILNIIC
jgi:hypothetical protein